MSASDMAIARKRVHNQDLAVQNLNSMFELRHCPHCEAEIHWFRTVNGKWMALNSKKRIGANWLVKNGHVIFAGGEGVFDCHFDDCKGDRA